MITRLLSSIVGLCVRVVGSIPATSQRILAQIESIYVHEGYVTVLRNRHYTVMVKVTDGVRTEVNIIHPKGKTPIFKHRSDSMYVLTQKLSAGIHLHVDGSIYAADNTDIEVHLHPEIYLHVVNTTKHFGIFKTVTGQCHGKEQDI